jgi:hypothetical protein
MRVWKQRDLSKKLRSGENFGLPEFPDVKIFAEKYV